MNTEEQQYLNLLKDILETGEDRKDRTGIGTKSVFGRTLRFNLQNNTLPLITTKKVFFRGVVEELLFFLRGETDTKKLEAKGINIWKGNTSREFLDSRGLNHLVEGDMGLMYGKQWRDFGGSKYEIGIDQLQNAINLIKNDPHSRRIMITALNPTQSKQMVLDPCHFFYQFYVGNDNTLSCQFHQRSVDCFLGLPFNICSYALLTHIIAQTAGLKAKELIFVGGDMHIYNSHFDAVKEQLSRETFNFPTIQIKKELRDINDIEALTFEDFELINYNSHAAIKVEMAI